MPQDRQKGFSAIEIILIVAALALTGIIGYLVFTAQENKKTQTNTSTSTTQPSDTTKETIIDQTTYKLTLPSGWSTTTSAPNKYVGTLATGIEAGGAYHYYIDQNGNYVAVVIDSTGRGFEANETWATTKTATGFVFSSKTTCTPGADFCTPSDATEYRVGVKTDGTLKNHAYFFFAGNTMQKTGVDTAVYKKIIESLVVK